MLTHELTGSEFCDSQIADFCAAAQNSDSVSPCSRMGLPDQSSGPCSTGPQRRCLAPRTRAALRRLGPGPQTGGGIPFFSRFARVVKLTMPRGRSGSVPAAYDSWTAEGKARSTGPRPALTPSARETVGPGPERLGTRLVRGPFESF